MSTDAGQGQRRARYMHAWQAAAHWPSRPPCGHRRRWPRACRPCARRTRRCASAPPGPSFLTTTTGPRTRACPPHLYQKREREGGGGTSKKVNIFFKKKKKKKRKRERERERGWFTTGKAMSQINLRNQLLETHAHFSLISFFSFLFFFSCSRLPLTDWPTMLSFCWIIFHCTSSIEPLHSKYLISTRRCWPTRCARSSACNEQILVIVIVFPTSPPSPHPCPPPFLPFSISPSPFSFFLSFSSPPPPLPSHA